MKTEFSKNGFAHRQIKRIGGVCLFARTKNGVTHYEVVRPITHGPYERGGIRFPAGEVYPSSEQWGQRGWTYRDLPEAEARFSSLVAKE